MKSGMLDAYLGTSPLLWVPPAFPEGFRLAGNEQDNLYENSKTKPQMFDQFNMSPAGDKNIAVLFICTHYDLLITSISIYIADII